MSAAAGGPPPPAPPPLRRLRITHIFDVLVGQRLMGRFRRIGRHVRPQIAAPSGVMNGRPRRSHQLFSTEPPPDLGTEADVSRYAATPSKMWVMRSPRGGGGAGGGGQAR